MKSGFVSIIGRPNVGKSTLINTIINRKVAITSNVSGTTRNIIQGIYNDSDTQIVFVDTPGIHKPINRLGKVLNKEALALTKDVDLILFVVDVASGIGKGDMFILESLKNNDVPVILVLNKIDEITTEKLFKTIDEFKDIYPEIIEQSNFSSYDNIIFINMCASSGIFHAESARTRAESYSSGGGGFSSGGGGGGSFGGGGGGGGFR